jgi:hypothetical protein
MGDSCRNIAITLKMPSGVESPDFRQLRTLYSAGESSDGRVGIAHAATAVSRIPPWLVSG